MKGVMILFHCQSNTGYAIGKLEVVFFQMAMQLTGGNPSLIHFAYSSMERGTPTTLPADFTQYVVIDSTSKDESHWRFIEQYIKKHQIQTLFGFDQPPSLPTYKSFRRGGIVDFIAYWGAPMSSVFGPLKRCVKRLEVALYRYGPDRYIFESHGMAETATKGRGIPAKKTRVVFLGIDTAVFHPDASDANYIYAQLGIPAHRKIFFYSGHMEPRKGVWVIIDAANYLAAHRAADDWHIVLMGNQPGQEKWLVDKLSTKGASHVTFGGYRMDINRLHRGCYAGVIASTGWDSLTYSSIEMQASGLPLITSDLPGLREATPPELPQLRFPPGDHKQLASLMSQLLDNPELHQTASELAYSRVCRELTTARQIENLVRAISD